MRLDVSNSSSCLSKYGMVAVKEMSQWETYGSGLARICGILNLALMNPSTVAILFGWIELGIKVWLCSPSNEMTAADGRILMGIGHFGEGMPPGGRTC